MTIDESFTAPRTGRPATSVDDAAGLAHELFGIDGPIVELGSQQDRNYLIDAGGARFLMKVVELGAEDSGPGAQDAALRHLAAAGLAVPEPLPTLSGAPFATIELAGGPASVRLLTFLEGAPLADSRHLAPRVVGQLGRLAGQVAAALRSFDHPGLDRPLQWDLRRAGAVVTAFAPSVRDPDLRARLEAITAEAVRRLRPLIADLPLQAVHGDVTADNVVCAAAPDGRPEPYGVIDFGDLTTGWRVAELAVACASVLPHRPDDPLSFLPAVRSFGEALPLTDAELAALWPLIALRGAVLVSSDEHQLAIDPSNRYASGNQSDDLQVFEAAASMPWELAEAAIRECVEPFRAPSPVRNPPPSFRPLLPALTTGDVVTLDLSPTSEALDEGRWLDPATEDLLFQASAPSSGVVVARYGEHRLTRAIAGARGAPATCALHVEVRLPAGRSVCAPAAAVVESAADDAMVLRLADVELRLYGLRAGVAAGSEVLAGDELGVVSASGADGPGRIRVQLCTVPGLEPPPFASAAASTAWRRLCPDPSPFLGIDCAAPVPDPQGLIDRRGRVFARVQGHYYEDPPQIERGFREYLVDTTGRAYVDMVNNVTLVGHGHPRLARASARQWSLLNTNSRFNYGVVAELCERLAALAPDGLDTVLLVNSGTEATDLALQVARSATSREIVIAVREAYHGWSLGADAVSTSLADNPLALETRPGWVRLLDAPNSYRGTHRGPPAARSYADDAVAAIDAWAVGGELPAAFIAEAVSGNAGGVLLPDGYLAAVYAAVRAHGGLCIADEVQVGYGRLGRFFWGFEQQGVVPDVVAVAKGMGNGQPLGAVITRRELADALAASGSFFSSTGGSPVSCRVGLTVLDVLEEEGLQANAVAIGGRLAARLHELEERHPLIGAIHGLGLYIGVELVRDRQSREPAAAEAAAICERFLELGVVVQPTGDRMNVLKVKPPLCLTTASADAFVDRLEEILTDGW